MSRKTTISIFVILTFIILRYLKYFFAYVIYGVDTWNVMDFDFRISILNYTQIFIVLGVTWIIFRKSPIDILGLKSGLYKGLFYGFICVIPMFIGYGYLTGFRSEFSLNLVHRDLILAGFYEELIFRGFIFGILYYHCGWGFISAALIPAVFFGIGHLYQAETFSDGIGVFIFTLLASVGFSWFYIAWKSLWMVIFLHGFMDLVWDMFSTQANVTGNLYVNIFRFTTLGLAIYFSVKNAKSENIYSLKGKLWVNR